MGRKKNPLPERLPCVDGNPKVALSAYELRLTEGQKFRSGNEAARERQWWRKETSQRKSMWERSWDGELVIVDGVEEDEESVRFSEAPTRKPKSKQRQRRVQVENVRVEIQSNPNFVAVRLAETALDFGSNTSSSVTTLFAGHYKILQIVHQKTEFKTRMFLHREGIEKFQLIVKLQTHNGEENTVFQGQASYWMGASESELLALIQCATSSSHPFVMPCVFSELDGKAILRYHFALNKAVVLKNLDQCFSNSPSSSKLQSCIKIVMEWLFPGSVSSQIASTGSLNSSDRLSDLGKFDTTSFFSQILPEKSRGELEENLIPCEIVSTLRPYQKRAVRWMLEREGIVGSKGISIRNYKEEFFFSFLGVDGLQILFCPFNATFVLETPQYLDEYTGGILAEEMGLGKTVEVLTCILANKGGNGSEGALEGANLRLLEQTDRNQSVRGEFVCACNKPDVDLPGGLLLCNSCGTHQHKACCLVDASFFHLCMQCRSQIALVPELYNLIPYSKSTLIVCPASIMMQWSAEVDKHCSANSVSVLIYEGVRVIEERIEKSVHVLAKAYHAVQEDPTSESKREALEQASSYYSKSMQMLWPQTLERFDIVLTTFEVLQKELHHVPTSKRKETEARFIFRHARKYRSAPSPLGSVRWRRIILDEAQEVENSTSAAAETASALDSKYRWAVTGTPIGKHGLDDLQGLLLFLRVEPLSVKSWWRAGILRPLNAGKPTAVKRMLAVFRSVLWRNTKRNVLKEIQLPGLVEHVHKLSFAPLEKHFYDKQHHEVQALLAESRSTGNGRKYSRDDGVTIFGPLLRLRQACCHPQIGSFGVKDSRRQGSRKVQKEFGGATPKRGSVKAPMTMEEIRRHLLSKAKLECEESQRLYFMYRNACAGVQLLLGNPAKAREIYQSILDQSTNYKAFITTDSLQRLHALEGLRSILEDQSSEGGTSDNNQTRSLHVERMKGQINKIRANFLSKYDTQVKAAAEQYEAKRNAAEEIDVVDYPGLASCESWWMLVIKAVKDAPDSETRVQALLERIQSDRSSGGAYASSKQQTSIVHQFSTLDGLSMVLQREVDNIKKVGKDLTTVVRQFAKPPTDKEIQESSECGTCRWYWERHGPMCENCKRNRVISKMENLLFVLSRESKKRAKPNDNDENEKEDEEEGFQYREPCELILILRILKSSLKSMPSVPHLSKLVKAADNHLRMFEAMSVQVFAARAVWRKKDSQLKACDELAMATLRIQFRGDDDVVTPEEEVWKILPQEAETKLASYELECARNFSQLRQALSQHRFLEGMHSDRSAPEGGQQLGSTNTREFSDTSSTKPMSTCPICQDPFGDKFAVLSCGHSFCNECVKKLKKFSSKCATCRAKFTNEDIRFVSQTSSNIPLSESGSHENITGQHIGVGNDNLPGHLKAGIGSKLDAVIGRLLLIEQLEPTNKCLVFSQWEEVLDILEHGMRRNDISFVRLHGRSQYNERLGLFRKDPSIRVLMMPLKSGAKGLNLTEANHVLLVEPICNPSIEAQAIGRIHRMGQERLAHVHHFIVSGTVEEKIYTLFRNKRIHSLQNDHQQHNSDYSSSTSRISSSSSSSSSSEHNHQGHVVEVDTNDILAKEKEELSYAEIQSLLE